MISYVLLILAMPSAQVECTISDIQYDEKLFTCITAQLELEDVWLESTQQSTTDLITQGAHVECTACDDSTETKMDFKSRIALLFLIVHVQDRGC